MTTPIAAPPAPGLVNSFFAGFVQMRETNRTQKALKKLTDRELDDIGLSRADLRDAATGDLIR